MSVSTQCRPGLIQSSPPLSLTQFCTKELMLLVSLQLTGANFVKLSITVVNCDLFSKCLDSLEIVLTSEISEIEKVYFFEMRVILIDRQ